MEDKKVLGQLAQGAGILFAGSLVAYLFKFIFRILFSRYFGPENYGLFSLGEMVLSIGILLALVGLSSGVVKFISHYFALGDVAKTKGSFLGALKVSFMLSLIVTLFFVFFSRQISIGIFNRPDLVSILIVFSLTIPIYTLLIIFSNALFAFKKPQYYFWSFSLGRNLAILLLTVVIILLGGTIFHVSIAYLFSFVLGLVMTFFFLEKKVFSFFKSKVVAKYNYRELMRFSLPLFFSGIFVAIMGWADTFFLGAMKSISDVGIYNVAMPLAASLALFLAAFGNIFYPIMNELHAKGQMQEMRETYSVVIRWLFMMSFPVVLVIMLFPGKILGIFFGQAYIGGSSVLVVLIAANFLSVIAGPCEYALMTFNKTKLIFYTDIAVTIVNLVLNIILIPIYGILGAAIATAFALVIRKVVFVLIVKRHIDFHFNGLYYLKFLISGGLAMMVVYVFIKYFSLFSLIAIIVALIVFIILYVFLLLIFKAFSKDDLFIMVALERKLGLKLGFLKKLFKKFI